MDEAATARYFPVCATDSQHAYWNEESLPTSFVEALKNNLLISKKKDCSRACQRLLVHDGIENSYERRTH